jgi:hypothetical protein
LSVFVWKKVSTWTFCKHIFVVFLNARLFEVRDISRKHFLGEFLDSGLTMQRNALNAQNYLKIYTGVVIYKLNFPELVCKKLSPWAFSKSVFWCFGIPLATKSSEMQ